MQSTAIADWEPVDSPTYSFADAVVPTISPVWYWISFSSGVACTYHGYKRNKSIGWALGWGLLGSLFPPITVPIAVAQGFGKKKGR